MLDIINYNFVYDDRTIFKNAEITLEKGHIYGLIGPNGSGKTTLLLSLAASNTPNSGEILYDKKNIYHDLKYLRHVSYLSDDVLITNKSADALVKKMSKIFSKSINWNIYDSLLEKLEIDPTEILKNQSKGKRKSAIITISLALEPKVILLDEFLDGLDIIRRTIIKDFLIKYAKENEAIVIISSHTMDDIKDMCDTLVFISDTKIKKPETLAQVKSKYSTYQIISDEILDRDYFIKRGIFVKEFKRLNNVVWIAVENNEMVLEKLDAANFKDIRKIDSSIEEVVYYELIS